MNLHEAVAERQLAAANGDSQAFYRALHRERELREATRMKGRSGRLARDPDFERKHPRAARGRQGGRFAMKARKDKKGCNKKVKRIALSFDDGPTTATPALLSALRRAGAKATFFQVGNQIEPNAALVQQMAAEGHEIANHTWTHAHLTQLSDQAIREELTRTSQAIQRVTGRAPRFFRPPYGEYDARVERIANELGMEMQLWDFDPETSGVAATEVQDVLKRLKGKRRLSLLMHDREESSKALAELLPRLQKKGYKFVSTERYAECYGDPTPS